MGAGPNLQPPRTPAQRQAFQQNSAAATAALGIPQIAPRVAAQEVQRIPRSEPRSTRQAPETIFGATPAANARSTGRSLVKDPVAAGSLLA